MNTTLFSKYDIKEELAPLSLGGRRFSAVQTGLDRAVELRLYEIDSPFPEEVFTELQRVLKLAARLDHPSIVPIFDVGYTESKLFWSTGLRRAISFRDFQAQNPGAMEHEDLLEVIRALLSALSVFEEKGVIHRCLSVDTVFYETSAKLPYISDLSLIEDRAQVISGSIPPWGPSLSQLPTCPEMLTGNPYDASTDLFFLGSLSYRLATGRAAVESPAALSGQKLLELFQVPPPKELNEDLPQGLSQVIMKLMRTDPEERPQSAAEALELLEDSLMAASEEIVIEKEEPERTLEEPERTLEEPERTLEELEAPLEEPEAPIEELEAPLEEQRDDRLPNLAILLTAFGSTVLIIALGLYFISFFPEEEGGGDRIASSKRELLPHIRSIQAEIEQSPTTRSNFISRFRLLRAYLAPVGEGERERHGLPTSKKLSAIKRSYYRSPARACRELSEIYDLVSKKGR